MLRIAIVTNESPPYRIPFFRMLGRMPDVVLQVLFCARREPNRLWEVPAFDFGHVFLKESIVTIHDRYVHNNPDVFAALRRFSPDVVVTGGFNPTHLYAFAYARLRGLPHVAMTDGTQVSESGLSRLHARVRRFVYARSQAFVAASMGGLKLYAGYGLPAESCFRAPLCIDNGAFAPQAALSERNVDMLFCGRFEKVKNPLFALDVAAATARKLGRKISIAFIGAGKQEPELRAAAMREDKLVNASFPGFLPHRSLPSFYQAARLFLFPTLWDPWGVVANEACAAGLPVLVSPNAGVAGELVVDGWNGFVCELNSDSWAERAAELLGREAVWQAFSRNSLRAVEDYSYGTAASGLLAACRHAAANKAPDGAVVYERYIDR